MLPRYAHIHEATRPRWHRRVGAAVSLLLVLGISGCNTHSATPPSVSVRDTLQSMQSGTPSTPSPAHDAQSAPASQVPKQSLEPIRGSNWVDSIDPIDPVYGTPPLVFHDLRVAEHESFYRVVVEFAGEGTPGIFLQQWTDKVFEQGRGLELEASGSVFLDLSLSGTSMDGNRGFFDLYYHGPSLKKIGPLEVEEDGTFENLTHIVIGMDRQRPFQIGILKAPARMVIDIQK